MLEAQELIHWAPFTLWPLERYSSIIYGYSCIIYGYSCIIFGASGTAITTDARRSSRRIPISLPRSAARCRPSSRLSSTAFSGTRRWCRFAAPNINPFAMYCKFEVLACGWRHQVSCGVWDLRSFLACWRRHATTVQVCIPENIPSPASDLRRCLSLSLALSLPPCEPRACTHVYPVASVRWLYMCTCTSTCIVASVCWLALAVGCADF